MTLCGRLSGTGVISFCVLHSSLTYDYPFPRGTVDSKPVYIIHAGGLALATWALIPAVRMSPSLKRLCFVIVVLSEREQPASKISID